MSIKTNDVLSHGLILGESYKITINEANVVYQCTEDHLNETYIKYDDDRQPLE